MPAARTGEVVFRETGSGTNGGAWPARWVTHDTAGTGTYDVQSGGLRVVTAGTGGFYTDLSNLIPSCPRSMNSEVLFRVKTAPALHEEYITVVLRSSGDYGGFYPQFGYMLALAPSGNNWSLAFCAFGTQTTIGTAVTHTFVNNASYWVRFRCQRGRLSASVWDDGTAEPAAWQFDQFDGQYNNPGQCSFYVQAGSGGLAETAVFDSITVWDLGG